MATMIFCMKLLHLWQFHQRGRWEVLLQLPIPADQLPPPRPPRALQTVLHAQFPKEKEGESPTFLPRGSCCEPARLHLERLLLLEGLGEVEVIEGGHCSICPEECLQLPALKTFPDSPWEVVIDVGKCSDPAYSAVPVNYTDGSKIAWKWKLQMKSFQTGQNLPLGQS